MDNKPRWSLHDWLRSVDLAAVVAAALDLPAAADELAFVRELTNDALAQKLAAAGLEGLSTVVTVALQSLRKQHVSTARELNTKFATDDHRGTVVPDHVELCKGKAKSLSLLPEVNAGKKSINANLRTTSVRFHVDCSLTKPGESVCVVGSLPELGNWDAAGAVVCETTAKTFPIWTSQEQVLDLRGQEETTIEFKVLVQGGKSEKWEVGPNRVLRLSPLCGPIDANITWCGLLKTGRSSADEKADIERANQHLLAAQKKDATHEAAMRAGIGNSKAANGSDQLSIPRLTQTMRQEAIKKAEEHAKVAEERERNWSNMASMTCKTPKTLAREASQFPDINLSCIGRHNHWDARECAVENVKEWQDAVQRYCAQHETVFGISHLIVPRHIHQIWIGPREPPCVWLDTWRVSFPSSNPGWEYTLWSDAQVEKLQMENRDLYDGEKMWQCKADILRLEILWWYGGIYIDADMVSVKDRAIEELIERSKATGWSIAYEPDTKDKPISVLGNSVICCTPFHPITMMLIKYLRATFRSKRNCLQVFELTGPVMYTKCLADMSYTVLPQELLYPAFHFVPNPSCVNYDRFPKALMFQFGYTCSNLEGWVKQNNCCKYSRCPYHFPAKWEPGPNRVLRVSEHGDLIEENTASRDIEVKVLVTERWGANSISVRFQVKCASAQPGECVFVVGSLPELGSWDPASALACETSTSSFPMWTSQAQILPLRAHEETRTEFKVLVQGETSATAKKGVAPLKKMSQEQADAEYFAGQWAAVKQQWTERLAVLGADSRSMEPAMGA